MAAKKSTKSAKRTTSRQGSGKRTARKKVAPTKRPVVRKLARPNRARRKTAHDVARVKAVGKRPIRRTTSAARKKPVRRKSQSVETVPFARGGTGSRSGGQSGDMQGLSNVASSDSESVDELLEEGNAFEADVVMGVEDAGDAEGREVRTHEVPEDDVPGEYLDKE